MQFPKNFPQGALCKFHPFAFLTHICFETNVQNIAPTTPMLQDIQPKPKIQTSLTIQ